MAAIISIGSPENDLVEQKTFVTIKLINQEAIDSVDKIQRLSKRSSHGVWQIVVLAHEVEGWIAMMKQEAESGQIERV